MRKSHRSPVLRELQALFSVGTHAGLTDGELLARFASRQGEAAELAFAALVERHGPMVFRVCRRVLVDPHTTEDAFQATFLILVRKAGTLRDRGSVGNWLYGVACRVAAKARTASARRLNHEQRFAGRVMTVGDGDDPDRTDLATLVHEEVGRLPERYRIPIVLCYLEGSTQEEAAVRLGWPIGTVRSRLARARERLRRRLTRRGVVPTTAGLVAALAGDVTAAPPGLVDATVKAAMQFAAVRAVAAGTVSASVDALALGVLRTMLMTKFKMVAAVLIALGTAAGAGVLATQDEPKDTAPPTTPKTRAPSVRVAPPARPVGRGAAVGEYLEKTKHEVDSALADLEAEVADLRARLQQAEENLRRMQSLQAALGDPSAKANAGGIVPEGMEGMMGDMNAAMGPPGMMRGGGAAGGMPGMMGGRGAAGGMPGMMGGRGSGGMGGMMGGPPGAMPGMPGMMGGYGAAMGGTMSKGVDKRSVDRRNKAGQVNTGEKPKVGEPSSRELPKGAERPTPEDTEDGAARARRLETIEQDIKRLIEERQRLNEKE